MTFSVLSIHHHGSVALNWPTGIALGAGDEFPAWQPSKCRKAVIGHW